MKKPAATQTFACESNKGDGNTMTYLAIGAMLLVATIGAMNGGTALAASTWDAFVTTMRGQLQSTFILAMAFIVVIVVVWQLAHGRGYQQAGMILGIFVFALVVPGLFTSVSTAMHPDDGLTIEASTESHTGSARAFITSPQR